MKDLKRLLDQNKEWAEGIRASDPEFFPKLAKQQTPTFLWIGCADSRVPATQLVGLGVGEMFVHRNVANIVVHTDFNCLSVMQYAVDVLKVDHIIVCGHDGCGGVKAALQNPQLGLIDNWLRHVQDIRERHPDSFSRGMTESHAIDRLCELNVLEQAANVCRTTIVLDAWKRGQPLTVHGWIYSIRNGLLRDLGLNVEREGTLTPQYTRVLDATNTSKPRAE